MFSIRINIFFLLLLSVLLFKLSKTESDELEYIEEESSNLLNEYKKCPFGYGGINCDIECGMKFFTEGLQIIGGKPARPHSWPSMAVVIIRYLFSINGTINTIYGNFQCAGSLIDEYTVLTAGHCVSNSTTIRRNNTDYFGKLASVFVVLGAHDISNVFEFGDIRPAYMLSVKTVIRNKYYDPYNALNDIALLKLASKARLNKYVELACLPTRNYKIPPNTPGIAVGWGLTSNNATTASRVLNEVTLIIYDGSACNNTAPEAIKNWNSQICAGDLSGKRAVCNGDSGGPLFTLEHFKGKSKYVVAGIVSYGDIIGCAAPGVLNVFTRVSYFIDWIYKKKQFYQFHYTKTNL